MMFSCAVLKGRRTGLPTRKVVSFSGMPFVSLKEINRVRAILDSMRLVMPGKAFCSWMAVSLKRIRPARTRAKDENPPTPRMKSARNAMMIPNAWIRLMPTRAADQALAKMFFPFMGLEIIDLWANPYRARVCISKGALVPTKRIFVAGSFSFNAWATAMPGNRWPPVFPPAMMTCLFFDMVCRRSYVH